MKKIVVLTLIVSFLAASVPAFGYDGYDDAPLMMFDALVVRPVSLAAIVVGTAFFIIALPFAATSGSVAPVARSLVESPFLYTFQRPIGNFNYPWWPGSDPYPNP
jgi:hypothetical protein